MVRSWKIVQTHRDWALRLCRRHILVHVRVLYSWVCLHQHVLPQLEEQVLKLVHCVWVVKSFIIVSDLSLLLSDLSGRTSSWVHIHGLETELGRMHVKFFLSHDRGSIKRSTPPKEAAEYYVPGVMNIEHVLPRNEVLGPEV